MGLSVKYNIAYTNKARKQIGLLKKSATLSDRKRLDVFLQELEFHPREGLGHPKQLRHRVGEVWSRKLNDKDRLVYEIFEDYILVEVQSVLGHYEDK